MNDHESEAMWQLYSTSSESIAIQTSFAKMVECLPDDVHLASIEYLDFEKDYSPRANALENVVKKRKSFEHERELRAMIWSREHSRERELKGNYRLLEPTEGGMKVPVDLPELIESIRVNPSAPGWFVGAVTDLVGRYQPSLSKCVMKSDLLKDPVF